MKKILLTLLIAVFSTAVVCAQNSTEKAVKQVKANTVISADKSSTVSPNATAASNSVAPASSIGGTATSAKSCCQSGASSGKSCCKNGSSSTATAPCAGHHEAEEHKSDK